MRRLGMLVCGLTAVGLLSSDAVLAGAQQRDRYRLDVKTEFSRKGDLAAAKIGAVAALREAGWARVVEFGEDYSVWLRNYESVVRGSRVVVYLEVELRTPAFIRSGRRLDFRELRVEFDAQEPWYGVQSLREAVEAELRDATESLRREAVSVGQAVADAVADMLGVR